MTPLRVRSNQAGIHFSYSLTVEFNRIGRMVHSPLVVFNWTDSVTRFTSVHGLPNVPHHVITADETLCR